ncbi:hypothetical protein F4777DRAFT_574173 [Nemania sp. FL0916]|nr:hypothetical protein F4777DRAFT_574173 [Nemania sp. FL0916]
MLSFRNRTHSRGDRDGGSSESHKSFPSSATTSSLGHKPFHTISTSKNSLRDRLKGLTKNIGKRGNSEHNKDKMAYVSAPWYNAKSEDDLMHLAPDDVQHIELAGQTWPAARKSISSSTPSSQTEHGSDDSCRWAEEGSHSSPSRLSKFGLKVSRDNAKRWATMTTRVRPVAPRSSAIQTRHSSFGDLREVAFGQDPGPAPQLPRLAESSDFLESLNRTGLFRIFTPLSRVNSAAAENFKVQKATVPTDHVPPVIVRLPIRLKSPDGICSKATSFRVRRRSSFQSKGSSEAASDQPSINLDNKLTQADCNPSHQGVQTRRQHGFPPGKLPDSSRHPIEWLDRVIETSYATRNPISPKFCVSKETMDFLRMNKTCVFVDCPRSLDRKNVPQPQRCYPGFSMAIEDICQRFSGFYAPFAAYNHSSRTLRLWAAGTQWPEGVLLEENTKCFNLYKTNSAWIKNKENLLPTRTDNTPTRASNPPKNVSGEALKTTSSSDQSFEKSTSSFDNSFQSSTSPRTPPNRYAKPCDSTYPVVEEDEDDDEDSASSSGDETSENSEDETSENSEALWA